MWVYNWVGGGYNTTHGDTREEAIKNMMTGHLKLKKSKGQMILPPRFPGQVTLVVDMKTLRRVTSEQLRIIDASYS
jgi:hypothetical protein